LEVAVRYFFVCGVPKSGTTWLQRLLDAHPRVVCSGEGHFADLLIEPIKRVQNQYNKQMAFDAEIVYGGKPYYSALEDRELAPLLRALIVTRMQHRMKPGATAVGDKTPRNFDFLGELLALFPDASFLHMVRDPRDVTVSVLYHGVREGYRDVLVPGSRNHNTIVERAAAAWRRAQDNFHRFSRKHPEQFQEVRYEDLVETPGESVKRVFDFLGVSASTSLVKEIIAGASFETLAGRPRGEEDATSFFRKGVVGDWKTKLEAETVARIDAACGAWMKRKNYASANRTRPTPDDPITLRFGG
jgi:hypothetical protein